MASKPKIPPMQSPMRHTWKKRFLGDVASIFKRDKKHHSTVEEFLSYFIPLFLVFTLWFILQLLSSTFFYLQKYALHQEYLSQGLFWWVGVLPNGLELFQLLAARFQLKKSRSLDDHCHKDFKPLNTSFRVIQRREPQQIGTPLSGQENKTLKWGIKQRDSLLLHI